MADVSRLAWVFAVLLPLGAHGDEPAAGASDRAPKVTVDDNRRTHTTTIAVAKDIPIEIRASVKGPSCEPTMALEYEQRNTVARVEATIDNPSCAACTGDYTIAVRVRDDSGDSRTLEFPGQWQRADDKPVTFTADYPVGTNVDVVNVRAKALHCVCGDAAPGATAGGAPKD